MGYTMLVVTALVVGAVCGYALYVAAQRDGRSPWVWGIVGLLTNIVGVVIYRVAVGPITLGDLAPGQWLDLSAEERQSLDRARGW